MDLPWEAAKEAYDHVVAVADAVGKELGGRGFLLGEGAVQAHVFLRLLGRGHLGAEDPDIVARLADELAAQPHGEDPDTTFGGPDRDDRPPTPDYSGPDDGPTPDAGPDGGPDRPGRGPETGPDGVALDLTAALET